MKYTTPLFEVKSLYQRHLALAGDSQALTALDAAYIYRINTPIMHAYWLPRRKQHIKTKATLPPERPVWIEYSEPLPRTHMQKMRSKATGSGPKPLHQRVAAPIKQGDVLPDVAALWFWAVDLRWRLDLIDTQGQSTEYLYFYTPSNSVFKGQWSFPHCHYEQCGRCTHEGPDFFPDHDVAQPCVIPHPGCEEDLRAWRNRLCEALELIQKNHYRPVGRFFL